MTLLSMKISVATISEGISLMAFKLTWSPVKSLMMKWLLEMFKLPTPSLTVMIEMSFAYSQLAILNVKLVIALLELSPSRMMKLLFIIVPFSPSMTNGISNLKTLLFTFPILRVSPKLKMTSSKKLPSSLKYSW